MVRGLAQWLEGPRSQEPHFVGADLQARIEAFVGHYNHHGYHESLGNPTPADVYFRGSTILVGRDRIKRKTIKIADCTTKKAQHKMTNKMAEILH
jgi:hypothetical protein